jgi:hypothetical protein
LDGLPSRNKVAGLTVKVFSQGSYMKKPKGWTIVSVLHQDVWRDSHPATRARMRRTNSKADCTKEPLYAVHGSAGGPIKSGVQQRTMRHSSISTTANYEDRVPADLRRAHEEVVHRALRHGRLCNSLRNWGGRRELNPHRNVLAIA